MASGALTRSDLLACLRSALAIGLGSLIAACSGATYGGPEWSARVIDMETGAPIEGAIAVVRWRLERYGGSFAGWLFVTEAVTDSDGVFHVPAWGPIKSPSSSGMRTRMSPNVPEVYIFKSGYRVQGDDCCSDTSYLNGYWNYGSGPSIRESWANGKSLALTKFYGDATQYREYLVNNFPLKGPSCAFIDTPRIYAAGIMEDRRLIANTETGISHLSLEDLEEHAGFDKCGTTVLVAVGRYLK